MQNHDEALVITGPTACGKSALAVEFAARHGCEILSMDSMAIYRAHGHRHRQAQHAAERARGAASPDRPGRRRASRSTRARWCDAAERTRQPTVHAARPTPRCSSAARRST
jgi:dephospho-CoA kinase